MTRLLRDVTDPMKLLIMLDVDSLYQYINLTIQRLIPENSTVWHADPYINFACNCMGLDKRALALAVIYKHFPAAQIMYPWNSELDNGAPYLIRILLTYVPPFGMSDATREAFMAMVQCLAFNWELRRYIRERRDISLEDRYKLGATLAAIYYYGPSQPNEDDLALLSIARMLKRHAIRFNIRVPVLLAIPDYWRYRVCRISLNNGPYTLYWLECAMYPDRYSGPPTPMIRFRDAKNLLLKSYGDGNIALETTKEIATLVYFYHGASPRWKKLIETLIFEPREIIGRKVDTDMDQELYNTLYRIEMTLHPRRYSGSQSVALRTTRLRDILKSKPFLEPKTRDVLRYFLHSTLPMYQQLFYEHGVTDTLHVDPYEYSKTYLP